MFSINRVFIAFLIQGIIYMIVMSIMEKFVDRALINNIAIFLVYFMLFLPNIVYAVVIEMLQNFIKSYLSFGIISAIIGVVILLVDHLIFGQSSIKKEALLGYFITYFIVSFYLKYLYRKQIKY